MAGKVVGSTSLKKLMLDSISEAVGVTYLKKLTLELAGTAVGATSSRKVREGKPDMIIGSADQLDDQRGLVVWI